MSARKRTAPESDGAPRTRRRLLGEGVAWGAALLAWPALAARADEAAGALPGPTQALLRESEFVYVSPLKPDGTESTCHGEVWYGWLDDHVVLITSRDSWKARSLAQGRRLARIWVGNHGRWKQLLGRNEEFRKAPRFDAQVEVSGDRELLERLMKVYAEKYPDEFSTWEPRFRSGFASGERVLLRYRPIVSAG